MKTSELKLLIEVAEQLGVNDVEVFLNNGRDGDTDFTKIKARFLQCGTTQNPSTILEITPC